MDADADRHRDLYNAARDTYFYVESVSDLVINGARLHVDAQGYVHAGAERDCQRCGAVQDVLPGRRADPER